MKFFPGRFKMKNKSGNNLKLKS